jgi:hypothetical protein
MRLQDVWTGEAAGLQQYRVTRQFGVVRRVRTAPTCCPFIASRYNAERPDSSVLRDACEQRGKATRRDGYRSVEDIISYSYTVVPYDLRGLPALGPPVGSWGLTVTVRP